MINVYRHFNYKNKRGKIPKHKRSTEDKASKALKMNHR